MLHMPTLPHSLFDDSPLTNDDWDHDAISESQESRDDALSGSYLDEYQLGELMGAGGCARVYRAMHVPTRQLAAVKISWDAVQASAYKDQHMHFCEVNALRRLSGLACSGLGASPTVFHDGLVLAENGICCWVAMQILGNNLDVMSSPTAKLTMKRRSVYLGMVSALEAVHKAGIAHRDVKPGNFTFGPEGRDNHIHVIDFGFAAVLPQRNNSCPASFCGTPDYASRNAMMGTHPHGAKDDVESLVYTLLDFHLRGLPWSTALPLVNGFWTTAQTEQMADDKEDAWQAQRKLGRVPSCLVDMLIYARALQPTSMPDYSHLRLLVFGLPEEAPAAVVTYMLAEE